MRSVQAEREPKEGEPLPGGVTSRRAGSALQSNVGRRGAARHLLGQLDRSSAPGGARGRCQESLLEGLGEVEMRVS